MLRTVALISAFIFLLFSVCSGQETAQKSLDQNVRIIYKPRAAGPDQSRGSVCIQGTVMLRIEFLSSGKIGQISVVKGLPYGLTENAIEAAKRIRFRPARREGKVVTVFKAVEFRFGIY